MERSGRAASGGLITEGKLAALRQALARGPVAFKSGAAVRRDPDWPADLLVDVSGQTSRVNEWASNQHEQAYEIALGIADRQPLPRPSKRGPSTRDWGPVPF